MNIIAYLADFLGSKTLGLSVRLIPLLGKAWDKVNGKIWDSPKANQWIYDSIKKHLPKGDDGEPKGTLEEMKDVIQTGKAFTAACYAFLNPNNDD